MVSIDDLIKIVALYNIEGIPNIRKAYELAENLHKGQFRQSGEPYIIHPLSVAIILAELHADIDTICAGLLHDTIEDTNITKEEIAREFNEDVAMLVDGVTKLAKMNFSSKQLCNDANTRKIITGFGKDIRIIILKLADRLHNMRTLEHKTPFKQKENSIETLELYAKFANKIGAHRIKNELEDLSFRYIDPDLYKRIEERKLEIEEECTPIIEEMLYKIKCILESKELPYEIKVRTKNIYGIYNCIYDKYDLNDIKNLTFNDIHDLLSFKIMLEEVDDCYRMLYWLHSEYKPINNKFKDYICNPKTNLYQSLHSTVFGPGERLVQTQIRTFDMDKIASFGLTAYWDIHKGNSREVMQDELRKKIPEYHSLKEIDYSFQDNEDFINQAKIELFGDQIYVYTPNGDVIKLPKDATPIDFAYEIHTSLGNKMEKVFVNDIEVPFNYVLQNKDRVRIITNEEINGPEEWWLDNVKTSKARRKIRDYFRK